MGLTAALVAGLLGSAGAAIAQNSPSPTESPQPSPPNLAPNQAPAPKPVTRESAQKKPLPPDQFPPNPLEITEPDPLIPYDYKERPLTAGERRELANAADRLTLVGATKLQQGDRVGAFAAWNRELRFRRLLGSLTSEVRALGRVGDVAWQQSDTTQLRYITQRLDAILAQAQIPASGTSGKITADSDQITDNSSNASSPTLTGSRRIALLDELGLAYQLVRLPKVAASIYDQILTDARQRNDSFKLESTLITLGQLNLAWFDYASAAKTYGELWQRSQARRDLFNTPIYLNQLAYIYDQAKQPAQVIPYLERLITFYQGTNNPQPIPALRTRIADHYQTLGRLDQAETNYQLAYSLAQAQQQYGAAGDALKKLAAMYRANNRLSSALKIYGFLVGIEQLAYNTYGVMNAYAEQGQIYLVQKQYPEAIAAFQQGLQVARSLKYQEDYFNTQIEKATKESSQ